MRIEIIDENGVFLLFRELSEELCDENMLDKIEEALEKVVISVDGELIPLLSKNSD